MSEKDSLEKLLIYQQDLQTEEECLKKIISKLNDQVHALQVEQLHILNAINRNTNANATTSQSSSNGNIAEMNLKKETVDPVSQELDLTIPNFQSSEEDEDDFDD
ncbi:uncharacterized protein LOC100679449 [Nasonia vitripennis]|uniref:Uncharacterized protein n=1 Tax=Nasonia vitripennis TaxID=7425 RepID=A0A7M7GCN6_NASVI|nr:uncharacterized protein LOC100679449 [Nasonia vitripennis]